MSILIRAPRTDVHARALQWALRRRGRQCEIWDIAEFPSAARLSARLSKSADLSISRVGSSGEHTSLSEFDTVWNRRGSQLTHVQQLSSGDLRYADAESRLFLSSLYMLGSATAVWVNDPISQVISGQKLHQLQIANQCGLKIAETLATNDPEQARAFAKQFGPEVVFKPFEIGMWGDADSNASKHVSYATKIRIEDLNDDISIIASPGIYQESIDKAFDVRLLVAGKSYLAAKISTGGSIGVDIDWRAAPNARLERLEIDADILEKTLNLMNALGVLTGSVDFVVDRDGTFYFLEINEGGQFLFLEEMSRDLPALNFFSSFLCSPCRDFAWDEADHEIEGMTLSDFFASEDFSDYKAELKQGVGRTGKPILQD